MFNLIFYLVKVMISYYSLNNIFFINVNSSFLIFVLVQKVVLIYNGDVVADHANVFDIASTF